MQKSFFIISFMLLLSCVNQKKIISTVSLPQQENSQPAAMLPKDTGKIAGNRYNPFPEINHSIIKVTLYDKFNPPVASRIFAYTNLTAHEVLSVFGLLKTAGTGLQLNDKVVLKYDTAYVFAVALTAQKKVAKSLVWSASKVETDFSSIINKWISINNLQTRKMEIDSFASIMADEIIAYSQKDGYALRFANKRYEVLYNEEGAWKPTAPLFSLPVEPYWKTVKTFLIDDRKSVEIKIPFSFSTLPDTDFYKMNEEVYQKSVSLTDTEKIIARHWDCNPVKTKNVGHVKLFSFRHTPSAHWLLIVSDIVLNSKLPVEKTVEMYSYLSLAMADAFIICWDMKYQYNLIRPETYINKFIKKEWRPYIETPSFPEYPSGHSLVSAAASKICNYYFGESLSFTDATQQAFGLPDSHYSNFNEAADEAGMSRYYGGIHFKKSIETGNQIGTLVGAFVVKKIPK